MHDLVTYVTVLMRLSLLVVVCRGGWVGEGGCLFVWEGQVKGGVFVVFDSFRISGCVCGGGGGGVRVLFCFVFL